ncbi:MAG: ParB/RepB/Spo0J family partition protein [Pseudomonadota bacterium]
MAAEQKSARLGRGLSALLGDDSEDYASLEQVKGTKTVAVSSLVPNPYQPRQDFEPGALEELANSIRQKGILQPLLVRPSSGDGVDYEIIAGERRWRVDTQRVNTVSEMIYRMSVAGFGTSVSISYLRGGADFDMQVELADAPNVPSPDETVLSRREVLEGLRVARLNPALLAELNLPLEAAGVVVLVPERLGRRVGLQRGDVIERVNDTPVAHPDDVRDVFSSSASGYRMTVLRGNRRLVLQFRV